MRECSACHQLKPESDFHRHGSGLRGQCKPCKNARSKADYSAAAPARREYAKAYRSENADQVRSYQQDYRAANRPRLLDAKRRHYSENAPAYKARVAAYQRANPEVKRATNQRRRAAGDVSAADIRFLFDAQKGRCPVCRCSLKNGYQVDHVVAIANGGTSDRENLQLLCPPCNRRKSAKDPIAFMQEEGFLL